jgi:hypothetical protein
MGERRSVLVMLVPGRALVLANLLVYEVFSDPVVFVAMLPDFVRSFLRLLSKCLN